MNRDTRRLGGAMNRDTRRLGGAMNRDTRRLGGARATRAPSSGDNNFRWRNLCLKLSHIVR